MGVISCLQVGNSDSITALNLHIQLSSYFIYIKKLQKLSLCNDQGLLAVLSTWECYAVDILTESFDILIQFSANRDSSSSESSALAAM